MQYSMVCIKREIVLAQTAGLQANSWRSEFHSTESGHDSPRGASCESPVASRAAVESPGWLRKVSESIELFHSRYSDQFLQPIFFRHMSYVPLLMTKNKRQNTMLFLALSCALGLWVCSRWSKSPPVLRCQSLDQKILRSLQPKAPNWRSSAE